MTVEHVPVLVVGAGPAGLTAAITLARLGVGCLLVERRAELASLPRATAISVRSMELLRGWGLEDAVRAGGVDVEWEQWHCRTLTAVADGHGTPTGYPTRGQSALLSPAPPACVPQDHLEPVLLDHLRTLPSARVALGTEVRHVDADPAGGGALVRLRVLADGTERTVRAGFVIAADGASSATRAAVGIPMHGPDDLARAASAVFRAPLTAVVGAHRYGLYAIDHPDAEGVFLPAGRGDRWLYAMFTNNPVTEDDLARRIRIGAGVPDLAPAIERVGAFRFAAQLAARFRHGDVFLVGDAAHRATPRGGTGMNTAIHDGHDLGWKLGWVLRGWAAPALLDTYEAERRPVVVHNVARSADPRGTARTADEELHTDLGGRLAHAWVRHDGRRVSTLDLLGPGLTLFTGPRDARWARAAAAHEPRTPPLTVRAVDAITARTLGIARSGALLVRPDGQTAMWAAGDAAAARTLAAAVAGVTGVPPRETGRLAVPGAAARPD